VAVGNRRFLSLFPDYFSYVHSVEGREWLYLFDEEMAGPAWRRIVFVGKDRSGSFRRRLARLSRDDLLFVDMYPDSSKVHIQQHQLDQLQGFGIAPTENPLPSKRGGKVILYPERGYAKQKWPYEGFFELYHRFYGQGVQPSLLEPFDTERPHPDSFRFDDLAEVMSFLKQSDLFVSNDCGMAHLAASCGLSTVTFFYEADPTIWHPLGNNRSLRCIPSPPTVTELLALVESVSGKQKVKK
jgi:ADP-heptose:LPS heptosyltransferase